MDQFPAQEAEAEAALNRAYAYWQAQLPIVETDEGLWRAAIALSMHALDDVQPKRVEKQLDDIADRVRRRCAHGGLKARVAHLHEVFFQELQFQGDARTYYNPLNSYLPAVLVRRQGNPITLTLTLKAVAARLDIPVEGINSPGHFLGRLFDGQSWMIVDAFAGGSVLHPEEARHRIGDCLGCPVDLEVLETRASHRAWLERMIRNLQFYFAAHHRDADLDAMHRFRRSLA